MAEEDQPGKGARGRMLRLSVTIVSAYLGRNQVPLSQIPNVINAVFGTLQGLEGTPPGPSRPSRAPAVPIKRSIAPDYIVCLEDGKKLKMLKRYLRTAYNMTPAEYRARWGLPPDYPMVAPNYAKRRSEFAKKIGLGRKPASGRRR
jgi:predicted transcriptional regulator